TRALGGHHERRGRGIPGAEEEEPERHEDDGRDEDADHDSAATVERRNDLAPAEVLLEHVAPPSDQNGSERHADARIHRKIVAYVQLDEGVHVRDLRARNEDDVVRLEDDVVLEAFAALNGAHVDRPRGRLAVRSAANQDDLLAVRRLRESPGLLDRLEQRDAAREPLDALPRDLAADVVAEAPWVADD